MLLCVEKKDYSGRGECMRARERELERKRKAEREREREGERIEGVCQALSGIFIQRIFL